MYKAAIFSLISALCTHNTIYCMNDDAEAAQIQPLLENANSSDNRKPTYFSRTAVCCLLFGGTFIAVAGVMHLMVQNECAGLDSYNSSLNCTNSDNVIVLYTSGVGHSPHSDTSSSENAHACHCSDLVLGQDIFGVGGAIGIASSATACLCEALHVAYKRCFASTDIPTASNLVN